MSPTLKPFPKLDTLWLHIYSIVFSEAAVSNADVYLRWKALIFSKQPVYCKKLFIYCIVRNYLVTLFYSYIFLELPQHNSSHNSNKFNWKHAASRNNNSIYIKNRNELSNKVFLKMFMK